MKSNILNQGDIGTGKTRSLITLLPQYIDETGDVCEGAGLQSFLLSMEPGAEAALGRNLCGVERAGDYVIHHHFISPVAVPWETLRDFVILANSVPMKTLLETSDPDKRQYRQFIEVFDCLRAFTCDHCGEDFGDATDWKEDRAICLDGVTGLTKAAKQCLIGGKPQPSLPEIGAIQGFIDGFLDKFFSVPCTAILLSHIDREVNPLTGMSTITVDTIGQKLAPKIVKKPDEIVTSHFDGKHFYWSTEPVEGTEVQKRRRLPYSADIVPDYSLIFKGAR